MYHLRLATLLFLSFLLASCDLLPDLPGEGETIDFENVENANRLDVPEAQTVVFKTETSWESFWNEHTGNGTDGSSPPQINFDEYMVIGVFWGDGPYSGCRNIADAIRSIRTGESKVVVRVGELAGLGQCLAIVQPRQVVKTEKASQVVRFRGKVPE